MSHEEFQGVEGAKKVILGILNEKGFARWSDFEKRLPKATVSRALRELEREGLVIKRGRYYVLVPKNFEALVRASYAPELCELIPDCANHEELAEDIIRSVGSSILRIEELRKKFVDERLHTLVTEDSIGSSLALLMRTLFQNIAIFTLALMESTRLLVLKKLMDEGCDIASGLPAEYAGFLRSIVEEDTKAASELFGTKVEELMEPLLKLREVLSKHGYRGTVRLGLRISPYSEVTLDIRELATLGVVKTVSKLEKMGVKGATQCFITLLKISENIEASGCRPLGAREREDLLRYCEDLVKALVRTR